jgi:chemotaxis protein methyltransferase CheR
MKEDLKKVNDVTSSDSRRPSADARKDQIVWLLRTLKNFAGFKFTTSLENKIHRALRNIRIDDLTQWLLKIQRESGTDELIAFVEELTNHETFFFRDLRQLDMLSGFIFPKFFESWEQGRFYKYRIWSSASSSGEEAYTLAMLFIDYALKNGFAKKSSDNEIKFSDGLELEVVGSDISRQAVRKASDSVFMSGGLASFRRMPDMYWKYFNKISDNVKNTPHVHKTEYFEPISTIKKRVKFYQHNLLDTYKNQFGQFDLVLCRNMMIYIDKEKQSVIHDNLYNSLLNNGYLIVSAVDQVEVKNRYCQSRYKSTVAYQRKSV